MIYQGFVGPSYTARSPRAGIETSMNWFVERMESPGAKMPSVLLPTPGVEAFATLTDAPVRGIFGQADRVFAVGGETLFEILEDGTVTNRGAVVSDSNPVTFAANGDAGGQIALTSGGKLYIFTLATNVFSGPVQDSTATDIKATSVAHMSGYFLAFDNTASKVTISDLNDGLTWDALQYFQRTRGGDPLVAMDVKTDEVWIWGEKTSEAWFNSGASPMPFEPISGAFFEHGMAAPSSVARVGTSFIWLASSAEGEGMVMQSSGFQPTRISTHAVEQEICTYAAIADAVAFTYQDDGHIFYVLNFPTAKATWVFDQTTGLWHERGTWDTTLIVFDAWRPQYHAMMWTKHLVGDRKTGDIFHMSSLFYKDVNAQGIRRVRRAPHLSSEERRMFYNKLQVDMDVGEGLPMPSSPSFPVTSSEPVFTDNGITTEEGYGCIFAMPAGVPCPYTVGDWVKISNGSGTFTKLNGMFQVTAVNDAKTQFSYVLRASAPASSTTADLGITAQQFFPDLDPQVMLRVSDDGGRTWGNERWASAGKIGEYKTRVIWFRLGSARDRVFEVSVSDPIPWRLVGAYLDVLPGLY